METYLKVFETTKLELTETILSVTKLKEQRAKVLQVFHVTTYRRFLTKLTLFIWQEWSNNRMTISYLEKVSLLIHLNYTRYQQRQMTHIKSHSDKNGNIIFN
jgi:hypothetical protein